MLILRVELDLSLPGSLEPVGSARYTSGGKLAKWQNICPSLGRVNRSYVQLWLLSNCTLLVHNLQRKRVLLCLLSSGDSSPIRTTLLNPRFSVIQSAPCTPQAPARYVVSSDACYLIEISHSHLSPQTASVVQQIFVALALHPAVQARAQAEVDAVIQGERLPNIDDRSRLPYVEAVFHEILRWRSITHLRACFCSP